MRKHLPAIALLAISLTKYNRDWLSPQWAMMAVLCSILAANYVRQVTFSTWAGLAVGWVLLSASELAFYRYGFYGNNSETTKTILAGYGGTSGFAICLILLAMLFIWRSRGFQHWSRAIAWVGFLDVVFVLTQWAMGGDHFTASGFFANPSMNGTFIAFTFPLMLREVRNRSGWWGWGLLIMVAASCVPSHTTSPYATLSAALIGIAVGAKNWRVLGCFLIGVGVLAAIGAYTQGTQIFFSSSGRLTAYEFFLDWFFAKPRDLVGLGQGSFYVVGPEAQMTVARGMGAVSQAEISRFVVERWGGYFLWAHSDLVQLVIEQGLIGAVIWAGLFLQAFWRLRGHAYLFGALAGFTAGCLYNYPFRWPVFAFVGAFLLTCALRLRPREMVK